MGEINIERRGYQTREEAAGALAAGGFVQACGGPTWYRATTKHSAHVCFDATVPEFVLEFFVEPDAAVLAGAEPWDPERLVSALRPDLRESARAEYAASQAARSEAT